MLWDQQVLALVLQVLWEQLVQVRQELLHVLVLQDVLQVLLQVVQVRQEVVRVLWDQEVHVLVLEDLLQVVLQEQLFQVRQELQVLQVLWEQLVQAQDIRQELLVLQVLWVLLVLVMQVPWQQVQVE